MKLQPIDIFIIGLYLVAMIVIGLVLKKKASKNMDSYFLGGKTLPFYMLGLSNASGQFDISGTMWMVTLFMELKVPGCPGSGLYLTRYS